MITGRMEQYLGNYRLLRLLGKGGQAVVYLGEHRYLKRLAAIKVLRASLDEESGEKFCVEAQLLAGLSHPHIIRVLEFGIEQGVPFFVMDYAPNGSVLTLCPRGTCLVSDAVADYVEQVADALQYAHDHHIIHRDIKPENLLLDEQQRILLSDFGIALLAPSPDLLNTQDLVGTFPYMAPEQLRGKPCMASDQYALGVVAYEWLCGCRPFGDSTGDIVYQQRTAPPPSLREKNPALSRVVEAVILKALAKDPRQRYKDVRTFAQALADACWGKAALQQYSFPATLPAAQSPAPAPSSPPFFQRPQSLATTIVPLAMMSPLRQLADGGREASISLAGKRQNRRRMLAKVRSFWITGFLAQALDQKAPINPAFSEYPEAIANPWEAVLPKVHAPARMFADGISITQIYDEGDGELLILGKPGSGKTILALELVRHLLERAEQDESYPMPVVVPLASWGEQRLPLALWLVEELNSKYQVPRHLGQQWVDGNALLPVLDGLDEVGAGNRAACIEAINTYRREYGIGPLVVCCRSEEYLAQSQRLLLRRAVMVQPFTNQQINEYLQRSGGDLETLRRALQSDPALQELSTTPLMLSILVSTYRDKPLEDLHALDSAETRQHQLFTAYVGQALRRRTTEYSAQQTKQWLSNLARQMKSHNQAIFYLEQMQPDWIKGSRWTLLLYDWLAVRLPGLLIGMLCGLVAINVPYNNTSIKELLMQAIMGGSIGLLSSRITRLPARRAIYGGRMQRARKPTWHDKIRASFTRTEHLSDALFVGLMIWSVEGPLKGLLFGFSTLLLSMFLAGGVSFTGSIKERIQKHMSTGMLIGFVYAFSDKLLSWPHSGLLSGVGVVMRDGLRYGLVGILLCLIFIGDQGEIQLSEIIAWSWRRLWRCLIHPRHVKLSILLCLCIGVAYGISNGLDKDVTHALSNGPVSGLAYGLSIALSYWLLVALFQGLSSNRLDDRQRILPDEGIRRSLRNVLYVSIISAIIGILIYALSNILYFGLHDGLRSMVNDLLSQGRHAAQARQGHVQVAPPHLSSSTKFIFAEGLRSGWKDTLSYWWMAALVSGLLIGLLSGGLACLRHGLLRLFLWRSRAFALNVPHFLDYAAECVLLRKVGGGYIFLHPLLLDYFASSGRQRLVRLIHRPVSPSLMQPVSCDPEAGPYQSGVMPAIRLPARKIE